MRATGLIWQLGVGRDVKLAGLLGVGLAGLALVGCGSDVRRGEPATGGAPGGVAGAAITGVVRGAGRPVAGASVMLYGAGSTGDGTGAQALLSTAVMTGAGGSFAVPAGYRCASGDQELYAVARGGTAGPAAVADGVLAEMTALGPCGAGRAASFVVNEATTVAAVWALRPFLTVGGDQTVSIGATATNGMGLAHAVTIAQALVSVTAGSAPGAGVAGTVTVPGAKVNTLASLLAVCVTDPGSAACGTVLGGKPDTLQAAVALAGAPGARVAEAFGALVGHTPAFAPVLSAAPPDWTLALTYRGGGLIAPTSVGLTGPTAVALDAGGRAWVTNYGGVLSVFEPTGTPVFADGLSGGGMGSSYAIAIDPDGNAWVTNTDSGTVTEWSGEGALLSGGGGYGAGDHPVGIGIAADGTVWLADNGNASVAKLNATGTAEGVFAVADLAFPQAVAVDGAGGVWVGNGTGMTLTHVDSSGAGVASVACCNGIAGLAVDQAGSVWAANYYGSSVSRVSAAGAVDAAGPYSAAGLSGPQGIAVDGAGAVWVASLRAPGIVELAGAGANAGGAVLSPPGGWATDAGLNQATGLAVDASGDVWVSNFAAGTVTEVVGLATPLKTPVRGLPEQP